MMKFESDPKSTSTTGGKWECRATRVPGCTVVTHRAGARADSGWHQVDAPLVAFARMGGCTTALGTRLIEADASTAWSEPAGERRRNRAAPRGAELLTIVPDAGWDRGPLREFRDILDRPVVVRDPAAVYDATRAFAETARADSLAEVALLGHVITLLARVARTHRETRRATRAPAWLTSARDYIHAHYRDGFDLAEVARVAGVSAAHLARTFNAHYGMPIGDYARRLRVSWAAERLCDGRATLAEVGVAAGFFDQSHFSREFRRHLGMTPAQYRRAAARR